MISRRKTIGERENKKPRVKFIHKCASATGRFLPGQIDRVDLLPSSCLVSETDEPTSYYNIIIMLRFVHVRVIIL